jgi:hypothetical protein
MNERPAADRLREAMRKANLDELEEAAEEIGRQAVAVAIAVEDKSDLIRQVEHASQIEEQRQRDLDAAHGDAIEVVRRAQVRQGRRVFSPHDGKTVRLIYELLRSMAGPDGGADNDPSFRE